VGYGVFLRRTDVRDAQESGATPRRGAARIPLRYEQIYEDVWFTVTGDDFVTDPTWDTQRACEEESAGESERGEYDDDLYLHLRPGVPLSDRESTAGGPPAPVAETPAGEPSVAAESPTSTGGVLATELPIHEDEEVSTENVFLVEVDEMASAEPNEAQSKDTDAGMTHTQTDRSAPKEEPATENSSPTVEEATEPSASEPQSEDTGAGMTYRGTDRSGKTGLPAWAIAIIAVVISFVIAGVVAFYMYRRGSLPCCYLPDISTGTGDDLTADVQGSLLEEGAMESSGGAEAEPQRGPEPESGPVVTTEG